MRMYYVLLLLVLLAAACTQVPSTTLSGDVGNVPAEGQAKELRIEAYQFGYRVLNDVQIHKGDRVRLTVSTADVTHGFVMPGYNIDLAPIEPGKPKTIEFVADKAGTFEYHCNVPCGEGHSEMKGNLTVYP